MTMRTALALAILVLSMVDGGFSLRFAGAFHEVNPLLRRLLCSPVSFVAAKTVLVALGVWILAARDRSRASFAMLVAGVAAYGAVDTYWVTRTGW